VKVVRSLDDFPSRELSLVLSLSLEREYNSFPSEKRGTRTSPREVTKAAWFSLGGGVRLPGNPSSVAGAAVEKRPPWATDTPQSIRSSPLRCALPPSQSIRLHPIGFPSAAPPVELSAGGITLRSYSDPKSWPVVRSTQRKRVVPEGPCAVCVARGKWKYV